MIDREINEWELPRQAPRLSQEEKHEQLDKWLQEEAPKYPKEIVRVIRRRRDPFANQLPPGLPPQQVIDHTITNGCAQSLSRVQLFATP